jgi:hypothetical protein
MTNWKKRSTTMKINWRGSANTFSTATAEGYSKLPIPDSLRVD